MPVALALIVRAFGRLELVWLVFVAAELICVPLALKLWHDHYTNVSSRL